MCFNILHNIENPNPHSQADRQTASSIKPCYDLLKRIGIIVPLKLKRFKTLNCALSHNECNCNDSE